eukprot:TRINITY_DN20096_c0_g1_i1.p1 TRINITY_DN20096_c0_g1~~TRINITY_DN20096_c0_g1_i1.p1  ORF type:complete len:1112 (+),score=181.51 TRINITY_DN20096_c0_g1_i1:59-3394(+)
MDPSTVSNYVQETFREGQRYHPYDAAVCVEFDLPLNVFRDHQGPRPCKVRTPRFGNYRMLVVVAQKDNAKETGGYLENVLVGCEGMDALKEVTDFKFDVYKGKKEQGALLTSWKTRFTFTFKSDKDRGTPTLLPLEKLPADINVVTISVTVRNTTAAYLRMAKNNQTAGLQNQGATCYVSSVIQTLFNITVFRRAVYELVSSTVQGSEKDIPVQLSCLFASLENSSGPVSTEALTNSFGWDTHMVTYEQHDVQEFARVLLDNLETKARLRNGDRSANVFTDLFKGTTKKHLKTESGFEKETEQIFYDLQLRVKGLSSLEDSIEEEIKEEHLAGENKYHIIDDDQGVDRMEDAVIRTEFGTLPPVLVVHLRRFEYSGSGTGGYVKVNNKFTYPDELSLPGETYLLHSVLVHSGTPHSGHYYAFVCTGPERNWHLYNDHRVVPVHPTEVFADNFGGPPPDDRFWLDPNTSAYMLLYIKKSEYETLCGGRCSAPEHISRSIPIRGRVAFSVFTEDDIRQHVSNSGQLDLLPDPCKGQVVVVPSGAKWGYLMEKISEVTQISTGMKLWTTTHWKRSPRRGFGRPDLCISDFGIVIGSALIRPAGEDVLPDFPSTCISEPLPLYITNGPCRESPTDRLVFIKRYLRHEGSGRLGYIGSMMCDNKSTVRKLVKDIAKTFETGDKTCLPRVWVERPPIDKANCPDVHEILDLRAQCDSVDGAVIIMEPSLVAAETVAKGVGGMPPEAVLAEAEEVLDTIGLGRGNIADHVPSLMLEDPTIQEAAQILLHPAVQLNEKRLFKHLSTYFRDFVTSVTVTFKSLDKDGIEDKGVSVRCHTWWGYPELAEYIAPLLRWRAGQLRFWVVSKNVAIRRKKQHLLYWDPSKKQPLGRALQLNPGGWYASLANGDEETEQVMFYRRTSQSIPGESHKEIPVVVYKNNGDLRYVSVQFKKRVGTPKLIAREVETQIGCDGKVLFVMAIQQRSVLRCYKGDSSVIVSDYVLSCSTFRVFWAPSGSEVVGHIIVLRTRGPLTSNLVYSQDPQVYELTPDSTPASLLSHTHGFTAAYFVLDTVLAEISPQECIVEALLRHHNTTVKGIALPRLCIVDGRNSRQQAVEIYN